jgi:hypothetical protein
MNSKFLIIAIGTWFLFMLAAIINAGIRNGVYKPILGDLRAHQLSTFIFIFIIFILTYFVLKYSQLELTTQQSFIIGTIWLMLTVCFEFLAGHYLFGNSWNNLISDYNILKGRIWSFVLVTLFFAPYLTNRLFIK